MTDRISEALLMSIAAEAAAVAARTMHVYMVRPHKNKLLSHP